MYRLHTKERFGITVHMIFPFYGGLIFSGTLATTTVAYTAWYTWTH